MSPEGFTRSRSGRALVWLREDIAPVLRAAGLDDPAFWEERLSEAPHAASGRGAVARVALPGGGLRLVLKRLARGGALAPLRGDRFAGKGRLLANLTIPRRAALRGIPTPQAAALVAIPGPPGFWRGRLGVEEIPGAEDLRVRLRRGPLAAREWEVVAGLLRTMHAAGLDHRDLNLGNVMLHSGPGGAEAFVVDLDGACLRDGPLSFARRQAALRRMERSCRRVLGAEAGAAAADRLYAAYPGGAADLEGRLAGGRAMGRVLLSLRSLGRGSRRGDVS